jgi:hypothetical protein
MAVTASEKNRRRHEHGALRRHREGQKGKSCAALTEPSGMSTFISRAKYLR